MTQVPSRPPVLWDESSRRGSRGREGGRGGAVVRTQPPDTQNLYPQSKKTGPPRVTMTRPHCPCVSVRTTSRT